MPPGPALAQYLAHRLVELGESERALVLQLPVWPSRVAPPAPVAVAVVRGAAWHVLAALDAWSAILAPPPALARFGRSWSWGADGPDAEALARELAALASCWWSETPRAVGALDVAGAITQALEAQLGAVRGAFGNLVHAVPGSVGGALDACVGIGREHAAPRGPELVHVRSATDAVVVRLLASDGGSPLLRVTEVDELARVIPGLVATLRETDDACALWCAQLRALTKPVRVLRAQVTPPFAGTSWRARKSAEITPGRPPVVVLEARAASKREVTLRVSARSTGVRVDVAQEAFDVVGEGDLPALVPAIVAALARAASTLDPERLVPGAGYRVVRAFADVAAGALLVFRRAVELKPSGVDAWIFDVAGVAIDEAPRALTLRADVPADAAVLDALSSHLAPIDGVSGGSPAPRARAPRRSPA